MLTALHEGCISLTDIAATAGHKNLESLKNYVEKPRTVKKLAINKSLENYVNASSSAPAPKPSTSVSSELPGADGENEENEMRHRGMMQFVSLYNCTFQFKL